MRIPRQRVAAALLLLTPAVAFAQRIPTELAVAAVSPAFVIILAGLLGLLRRSWRVAGRHAGLIVLWILLLGLFMYITEYDYVIWTPLAIYVLHSILIVLLILLEFGKRIAGLVRRRHSGR